jgi:hypothetical protein
MRYARARVLTAWPASDELTRPWLGYVAQPFRVLRIEDFTPAQVALASAARSQFDVALVFSTKYQPAHPLLESWTWWQHVKERFFGYHRDLPAEEIARRVGGRIVFHKESDGQWIAVIAKEREENAAMEMAPFSARTEHKVPRLPLTALGVARDDRTVSLPSGGTSVF